MKKTYALAATGVAAALVAVPLSATAAEDADPSTGTVTVTRFDDRYQDGVFDTSKTTVNGERDAKNTSLSMNLIDVDGVRHYLSANEAGDYVFENVPVGMATLYMTYPNGPAGEVLFDATGATSAADIERLPSGEYFGPAAVATIDVDADGESRLYGMSALRLVANVQYADGTPASGLTVQLGSDEFYPATEYDFRAGTYEAFQAGGYIRHTPGELGLRLTAPEGYRVASVTAANYEGDTAITVTERDGAWWFPSTQVVNYFWNPFFTVTLEQLPDTTKPVATLVTPTTAGPFSALSLRVDATDDRGIERIVANIYKGGKLVKSTQTAVNGALTGTHSATVNLPDGDYTIRYNAEDLAGNIAKTSSFDVTIDATAPKVTVKNGAKYTAENGAGYDLISFKLQDKGQIDRVELNGKVKDLTNNEWSDVNFIKPGTFGGVKGENTLVVFDVAGNSTTTTFILN